MKSKKKLSKHQSILIIMASLLIFLNEIIGRLYLAKTFTLTEYKYIFISFSSIIIITALLLKKKFDNIYLTLAIIMIGVCNIFNSIMTIERIGIFYIFVFYFLWCLSFILLLAFITQAEKE